MNSGEFLDHLRGLDIELISDGDQLLARAPKGLLTPELHAQIAARRWELLQFLGAPTTEQAPLPPITPALAPGEPPLSFGQERLWFLDAVGPTAAYNIPLGFRLRGTLDRPALERSLAAIVDRHEVLRTVYPSVDGRPAARVTPPGALQLAFEDLGHLTESAREDEVARRFDCEEEDIFDLARGPLFRALLFRCGDQDHVLLLNVHHIVFDLWSWTVLLGELGTLYAACLADRPSPLPKLWVQYGDVAAWQRALDASGAWLGDRRYWERQLADAPVNLALTLDRPRPATRSDRGAEVHFEISAAAAASLRRLAADERATPFMVFLAAFQALLSRYSGQDDVLVGTAVANRQRPETDPLIGFFVNTAVIRSRIEDGLNFRGLLRRVREATLDAHAHQNLPFEQVVQAVRPDRDPSQTPLFQAMFLYQTAPGAVLSLPGVDVSRLHAETRTSKFDLTLSMTDGQGDCRGRLEYSTDLFHQDTLVRMADSFRVLLDAIAANPDGPVAELPLLSEAERRRIVVDWNRTAPAFPMDERLHRLFEAQARRTPDGVVLVSEAENLTYRELDHRANELAHRLRAAGVGPESVVAVYLERKPLLVVAMLAVLKAGGAYVPIDPRYPPARAQLLREDSQAGVVLTESHLAGRLPAHSGLLLCLDTDPTNAGDVSDLDGGAAPDNLAYVIYTSGSTGKPKGVAIEHRQAVALIHWASQVYGPADRAGVLAATSACFDLSVFELFLPLCFGGTAILVEDALRLHEAARRWPVTLVNTVPSVMAEVLRLGALPPSVATVNLAGEPVSAALVDALYRHPGVGRVFDLYGVSEAATYSTFALQRRDGPVTIGGPIAHTQIYILDAHRQPVPVGVVGELWIGGEGVARGYLRQPELTAERFVADFVSGAPGARLFRTGDLARYRADGAIEFLGRRDDQVKLRGFRIEVGEVEAALTAVPGVRQAAVLVREDEAVGQELVAYIAADPDHRVTAGDVRAYLRERLPNYMVPSSVAVLDALPLGSTGKLDRQRLPSLAEVRDPPRRELAAAETPVEEVLVGIWAEVLGAPEIGVEDDFFDLGGHSLLVIYLLARIRDVFHVELPVRLMFEKRTIAEQAREIGAAAAAAPRALPAVQAGKPPTVGVTQGLVWLYHVIAPGDRSFNIPLRIRLAGRLDVRLLVRALDEIVQRHEVLRTSYAARGERIAVSVAPEMPRAAQVTDLGHLRDAELARAVEELAEVEARVEFDLARGPLFRFHVLRLRADEHILLATFHHMVFDGWSVNVFGRELAAVYGALSRGRPSPLDLLPIQYLDYAGWLRTDDASLVAQLDYWKRKLAGELPRFPVVRPPPLEGAEFNIDREPVSLSSECVAGLRRTARREKASLFMTILAAFQAVLSHWAGVSDVRVGTLVANRQRRETEGLIGLVANTVVLRSEIRADEPLGQLLRRVRDTTLEAYANQEVPFPRVVAGLRPEPRDDEVPLCPVMLTLDQPVRIPSVSTASGAIEVELTSVAAAPEVMAPSFELVLELAERDGALNGWLVYKVEHFAQQDVQRMVLELRKVLGAMQDQPDRSLRQVLGPLRHDAARHTVARGSVR